MCLDVFRERELLKEKRRRRQELFQEQKVGSPASCAFSPDPSTFRSSTYEACSLKQLFGLITKLGAIYVQYSTVIRVTSLSGP